MNLPSMCPLLVLGPSNSFTRPELSKKRHVVPPAPTALRRRAVLEMTGLERKETNKQRPLLGGRQQQGLPAIRRDGEWSLVSHRRLRSKLLRLPSWSSPYLLMDVREMLAEAGML